MEGKIGFGFVLVICLAYVWQGHVEAQVNCMEKGAGRFPDESDTTCQNYILCVLNSATDGYMSYNYTCPTTSVFNPNTAKCTTDYECDVTDTTTSSSSDSTDSTTSSE